MSLDPVRHRAWLNDDGWFVDACLFGRCGAAAQQAAERVIRQYSLGEPWDHTRMADQILQQL